VKARARPLDSVASPQSKLLALVTQSYFEAVSFEACTVQSGTRQ